MKVQVKNLRKEFGKTVGRGPTSPSRSTRPHLRFRRSERRGQDHDHADHFHHRGTDGWRCVVEWHFGCEEPELARRAVGYVPDTLPAHPDITVHEYLDFYARAYGLRGKKRTQAVEAIEEFTNVTGIREKHLKERRFPRA
ncbi:MAG: hypothetical protein WDM80_17700 [Limisphaerales bacterium]